MCIERFQGASRVSGGFGRVKGKFKRASRSLYLKMFQGDLKGFGVFWGMAFGQMAGHSLFSLRRLC